MYKLVFSYERNPYVCPQCGAKYVLHNKYWPLFVFTAGCIFWLGVGVIVVLELSTRFVLLTLPIAFWAGWKIVYGRKYLRTKEIKS